MTTTTKPETIPTATRLDVCRAILRHGRERIDSTTASGREARLAISKAFGLLSNVAGGNLSLSLAISGMMDLARRPDGFNAAAEPSRFHAFSACAACVRILDLPF